MTSEYVCDKCLSLSRDVSISLSVYVEEAIVRKKERKRQRKMGVCVCHSSLFIYLSHVVHRGCLCCVQTGTGAGCRAGSHGGEGGFP